MTRIVVTGGNGFIGSHLVERLARDGHEIVAYDTAPPPPDLPLHILPGVRHVKGDVTSESALASVITPAVDVVYHLSALVGVDRYLRQPLDVIDVNVLGTRNVLRLALDSGARVVVASTSEVYGKNPQVPWSEDSDRVLGVTSADRWTYSTSKALAEHMAFALTREHGLRATVVRFFNVYGPRQRPAYVVSRSVQRVLSGQAPEVYDTGRQTRCFTYIDDAIEGTVRAAAHPDAIGEAFNIGSHQETTVGEVIGLVREAAGFAGDNDVLDTGAAFGTAYQDIERRIPDTAKARTVLGWQCEVPLREGIARTVEWARRNPWWWRGPLD
ncbi:NAD-dependent epimerase/dehydratase family protein [Nonomuraea sp. PA05]|uniref:NAD-dependent epimerase/dehydratase family protein n=1 Tax=Nonomuraea sp. PA05 TaxID=2604466 RepID=UPI0011D6D641|nr:NAD-dependent epimerase/dehydratase family protein [Nonomuraea sp. PA05]TYB60715.1 NAD-dependent epimerase/dehydratase family protein [Nonomuraea sp. PA05]